MAKINNVPRLAEIIETPDSSCSTAFFEYDDLETPPPRSERTTTTRPNKSFSFSHDDHYTPVEKFGLRLRRIRNGMLSSGDVKSGYFSPQKHVEEKWDEKMHGGNGFVLLHYGRFISKEVKLCMASFLMLMLFLCWASIRTYCPPPEVLIFRPYSIMNSIQHSSSSMSSTVPSQEAIMRYRKSYESDNKGWILVDDPLNPGSIFCLLEEKRPSTSGFVKNEEVREFVVGYKQFMQEELTKLLTSREKFSQEHVSIEDMNNDEMIRTTSYYSLAEEKALPHLGESLYVSPDGTGILVEIRFAVPPSLSTIGSRVDDDNGTIISTVEEYSSAVLDILYRYENLKQPHGLKIFHAGLPIIQRALMTQSRIDPSSLPVKTEIVSLKDMIPKSTRTEEEHEHFANVFGWGRLSPYRIIFHHCKAGKKNKTLHSTEAFRFMHTVMEKTFAHIDAEMASSLEMSEGNEEMVSGVKAVNLDSIPQRIEDGHFVEHLDEVMDELFGRRMMNEGNGVGKMNNDVDSHNGYRLHIHTTYDGIAYLRNNPVPYPLFLGASICAQKQQKEHHRDCPLELLNVFMYLTEEATSVDAQTTFVTATLGMDPFSERGLNWLKAVRMKLDELRNSGFFDDFGFCVHVEGGASVEYDALLLRQKGVI